MSGAGPEELHRFATARLAAERLHARDLEDLIALHLDPEVSRYLGGVRSAQTTKAYLATNLAHWDRHGFGLWTLRTPAGAFVGRAGVRCVEVEGRPEVEIAYALGRSFWGRGLASEIAEALTTIGLERLKLPSLVGIVMVEHAASHRVLEKAGYTPEGVVVFHDADCVAHRRLRDQRPDPSPQT